MELILCIFRVLLFSVSFGHSEELPRAGVSRAGAGVADAGAGGDQAHLKDASWFHRAQSQVWSPNLLICPTPSSLGAAAADLLLGLEALSEGEELLGVQCHRHPHPLQVSPLQSNTDPNNPSSMSTPSPSSTLIIPLLGIPTLSADTQRRRPTPGFPTPYS